MAVIMTPAPQASLPTHSGPRQNIISSSLEEKHVDFFLNNLYAYLDDHFLPAAKHVHVLFHLATLPDQTQEPQQSTPLSLLDRISTLYPPSAIGGYLPVPGQKDQRWEYECTGGPIEREARRRLNACRDDGVFGLFWRRNPSGKNSRPSMGRTGRGGDQEGQGGDDDDDDDEEEDEEEEDGERSKREVDENAWELVRWVIRLWKRDQELYRKDNPNQPALSPLFLGQFRNVPRKQGDLQLSDLALPVAVIRSAYLQSGDLPPSQTQSSVIRDILSLILPLLHDPLPLFHPPSLPSSLFVLSRSLPSAHLAHFLSLLSEQLCPSLTAHVMTIMLEDLGGVRFERAEERLRNAKRGDAEGDGTQHSADLDEDKKRWEVGLAPPTVPYLLHGLLPLAPAGISRSNQGSEGRDEVRRKMGWIKLQLISLVDEVFPVGEEAAWQEVGALGDRWLRRAAKTVDRESWSGIEDALGAIRDELTGGRQSG